jgi:hypothetical protein
MMLVAVDGARGAVEAMVESDAIGTGEAAAVGNAHVPFRAADAHFAAFEAVCLARREAACSYGPRDAMLLHGTALVDGGMVSRIGMRRRWSGLAKANG